MEASHLGMVGDGQIKTLHHIVFLKLEVVSRVMEM